MNVIGREKEVKRLKKIFNSKKPELVVIKGRRRVGKTFLIQNTFENDFIFSHTGLSPAELDESDASKLTQQLEYFYLSLLRYGYKGKKKITTWSQAFFELEKLIDNKKTKKRQVIFIDELPWLDTPKSSFIAGFSNFWNNYASKKSNLMVIVCGSSNSWMDDVFFNSYGGFYRRATQEIKLAPFDLKETKELLASNNVFCSDYEIIRTYMIFGGMPFYLNQIDSDYSLGVNIDNLFFGKEAILNNEFDLLFNSTVKRADDAKKIIRFLSKKRIGFTKEEISEAVSISDGGGLTNILKSLISSDIIMKYSPINEKKNVNYYKLIDPFCLFYLKFVENNNSLDPTFWQDHQFSHSFISYAGFAFENLAFYHLDKIKEALGVAAVTSELSSLVVNNEDRGAQIDLIIIRKDNVVDSCEIKFYNEQFVLEKDYLENLRNKDGVLSSKLRKRQIIEHVLISPYGIKKNMYSNYFQKVVTLEDLFR